MEHDFVSAACVGRVARKGKQAGLSGNQGGWIKLPCGKRVQGWFDVWVWAKAAARYLPENLLEIAEGTRIGTPTLRRGDEMELAVGLLSPVSVCWRD